MTVAFTLLVLPTAARAEDDQDAKGQPKPDAAKADGKLKGLPADVEKLQKGFEALKIMNAEQQKELERSRKTIEILQNALDVLSGHVKTVKKPEGPDPLLANITNTLVQINANLTQLNQRVSDLETERKLELLIRMRQEDGAKRHCKECDSRAARCAALAYYPPCYPWSYATPQYASMSASPVVYCANPAQTTCNQNHSHSICGH
jgi:hypothetical protein